MEELKIKPLFDRVIIQHIEAEEILKNGISLPDNIENTLAQGKVMAIGNEVTQFKVGDTILHQRGEGDDLYIDGEPYIIMPERTVKAVI